MSDILERILAHKAGEVAGRAGTTPLSDLRRRCAASLPPTRGFADALGDRLARGRPGVIAEVKKASPSKGVI
ncbi:MAG: indole-3-glycerol-phosphate synthase TrpC, partial [Gammaproteobacteria bacterium]|nr:indole-3-glycerol-phosphate synthase TrpC [Gammaproteobacteria bacterium]